MSVNQHSFDEIDLDSIIRSRVGSKAKYIPRFATRWVERLIHQEFINCYLRRGDVGVSFCQGALDYLGVEVEVQGAENLPQDRLCTFVSNHPLGAIDGLTLGAVLGAHYNGKVKYLVNDLLMNLKGLAPLCVPVNVIGKQGRGLPAMIDGVFGSGDHVIMFPGRLCSRKMDDGQIRDLPWNKAFVSKSIQYQRDIVPIHFVGQNSNRFYNVARWCKRLHLPNFAMALLPDEMYRGCGNKYVVKIGEPIPWQTFDGSRSPVQWAAWIQDKVYAI